jgi:hypothetical protein
MQSRGFDGKDRRKSPLAGARPRRNNNKMDLAERECGGTQWIILAQCTVP